MADDGRRIHITEPTRLTGKGSESSTARSRYGKEIRVRDRRHSTPVRVQYAHSKPHQEKREDRQSHYADRTQNHRRCGHGTRTGRTQKRGTQIRRYGHGVQRKKRSHARSGGDTVASLTARPFGRLREGTRNTESTRFRHRHAGELQRINRKSKEQENVQCFRNRGGCTEKRDSAKLHGGTARKQEENTLCGYRTKFLPLCESGKKNIAHGGTADRQEP